MTSIFIGFQEFLFFNLPHYSKCPVDSKTYQQLFNFLIREDKKVLTLTDVHAKAALSSHYFKAVSGGLTKCRTQLASRAGS